MLSIFILQHLWILGVLLVWEMVWKGVALWRSARLEQKAWFVAILIINSVGILPILYLTVFSKAEKK